jgi:hypothetical protein
MTIVTADLGHRERLVTSKCFRNASEADISRDGNPSPSCQQRTIEAFDVHRSIGRWTRFIPF